MKIDNWQSSQIFGSEAMELGNTLSYGYEMNVSLSVMWCSCCYSSNFSIFIPHKDGGNLLFAAARSGNASLFLWLLDECKLQPVTDKVGF